MGRNAVVLLVATVGLSLLLGPVHAQSGPYANYFPDVRYRLETGIAEGRIVYVGRGGDIDGEVNPTLRVPLGALVQVTMVNREGLHHQLALPAFSAFTDPVATENAASVTSFRATREGVFDYFCDGPGHRAAGMVSQVIVGSGPVASDPNVRPSSP